MAAAIGAWSVCWDVKKAPTAMASFASSSALAHPSSFSKQQFEHFLLTLQGTICDEASEADGSGKMFSYEKWQRGEDTSCGYGITRVIEQGFLLEKAASNVSIIRGQLSETRAKAGNECSWSIEGGPGWFGGGADLTPCYLFEEDARGFHAFYKEICDKYDPHLYQQCKDACDSYFFLPARKEHRGIGGIFFDDLDRVDGQDTVGSSCEHIDEVYAFVKEVAMGFMPSFLPIAEKRNKMQFGEKERQWQLLRRGRYLEFNLLYDRGVKFGLDGGRIESIMVSAPPLVAWRYNVVPEVTSPEARLLEVLHSPRSWT